jgi:hypothetical protein
MSNENSNRYPLGEPSVLDYVKSLFRFGNGERIRIPEFVEEEQFVVGSEQYSVTDLPVREVQPEAIVLEQPVIVTTTFPWRSLLGFFIALIGQRLFEPPPTVAPLGYAFYIGALILIGWAIRRGEWSLPALPESVYVTDSMKYNPWLSIGSAILIVWAFLLFNNNLFTIPNVIVWVIAVVAFIRAFWVTRKREPRVPVENQFFIQRYGWMILLIAATVLVFFFRFYRTLDIPPEPFSDHAEKILDVYDVSQGQTHIFFPRNTGREAFQMYWTLLISWIFRTGLSFLSLKLGTAILGFLTLPFIYLLGKEIGGRRVGLFAFIMAGIGYWPNVISRVGLRFPLYPLFVAPTLYFLVRGLRTRNRNDFLISGLFLGLGLHGYSPFRIVPLVVIAAFALYWLHEKSTQARRDSLIWLVLIALTSLFVFMPLLRYWIDNPEMFSFRAMTRLSGVENPITQPIWKIFISNTWNAFKMFNFDDGEIWVHSVTHRPALDVITAALFVIGTILVIVRYVRKRNWLDLFLLISIPILLLPSILSLAYPAENPALNRASGAYIPAFILGAMALDSLVSAIGLDVSRKRAFVSYGLLGVLLLLSARQNYDLVFNQYYNSFRLGSWNTSDMGRVISQFRDAYGTTDTVWIVPFPYWVDTRLPAVWAGIPNRDMAMWREDLPSTVELPGPKLFLVKANVDEPDGNDQETLNALESLYPDGQLRLFDSDVPGHDFWIFSVQNK